MLQDFLYLLRPRAAKIFVSFMAIATFLPLLPLPAFAQTSVRQGYDVQIGVVASKGKVRSLAHKYKKIGAPIYTVSEHGTWKLIADTNTSYQNANSFIETRLSDTNAVPVESKLDVAPSTALVRTGIYPVNQLYSYVPEPGKSSNNNKSESSTGEAARRITVRELAGMPSADNPSASELAALPPRPPDLSARDLVRLARDSDSTEEIDSEADIPQDPVTEANYNASDTDRAQFVEVMTEYIYHEYANNSFCNESPEFARKMALYYATWIYDAARLYKLDPFLMVAIPHHETNFMNVNGDLDHFTNGVRNHSEGIFQMLKTTQLEVYQDMKERGLGGLITWRPGQDLKKFPRDQAYMAAHFLRFFCEAYPKNYRHALTTYNGSSSYPNKVFQKLDKVARFYTQQTS